MGTASERTEDDSLPSQMETLAVSDNLETSQSSSEGTEAIEANETATDTASIATTTDASQENQTFLRGEAKEAVTDSDRVAASGNLKIRSKRTERRQRKMLKKTAKKSSQPAHIFDLPNEALNNILVYLLPSDLFRVSRTCRHLYEYVKHDEAILAREIIAARYPILEKCFRLPIPLSEVDPETHSRLQHPDRVAALNIHRRYQHIPPADPHRTCTCLTCVIRWNALSNAVDFVNWQQNLEKGEPIPIMDRGKPLPEWNRLLVDQTMNLVSRAVTSPLLHACILESHLKNTVVAIKRHSQNKGNKRRHFQMTQADIESQSDLFLDRQGPVTTELPFHRDNYYMLEAMMPSRTWLTEKKRWGYMPAEAHDNDLAWVATRWQMPRPS
ncbi:hypothetical protein COL922a_012917 [Colletotrichum nupharicola]|nr:hypothetical protein COL922a_012917 [Colletotrichum nupharicola]